MARFAQGTRVSSDRSKAEVERTLSRYGADQFAYGVDGDRAVIGFRMKGADGHRMVKFEVPLPRLEDFSSTGRSGRARSAATTRTEHDKAVRQRWRAVALIVKAKLEAVEAGITTFEQEWLAYVLLPGGETVGDRALLEVAKAYEKGEPPRLLLGMKP